MSGFVANLVSRGAFMPAQAVLPSGAAIASVDAPPAMPGSGMKAAAPGTPGVRTPGSLPATQGIRDGRQLHGKLLDEPAAPAPVADAYPGAAAIDEGPLAIRQVAREPGSPGAAGRVEISRPIEAVPGLRASHAETARTVSSAAIGGQHPEATPPMAAAHGAQEVAHELLPSNHTPITRPAILESIGAKFPVEVDIAPAPAFNAAPILPRQPAARQPEAQPPAIDVHIGTIEVGAPPARRAEAPVQAPAPKSQGFARYTRLRRYRMPYA